MENLYNTYIIGLFKDFCQVNFINFFVILYAQFCFTFIICLKWIMYDIGHLFVSFFKSKFNFFKF